MKCYKGGKQHNFKPRYDQMRNNIVVEKSRGISATELKTLMYDDIYIKDICVWCGKEVQKRT
jgi:hypothetical protein